MVNDAYTPPMTLRRIPHDSSIMLRAAGKFTVFREMRSDAAYDAAPAPHCCVSWTKNPGSWQRHSKFMCLMNRTGGRLDE